MNNLHLTQTSSTTFAAAFGAAIFSGQMQHLPRVESYQLVQPSQTHSIFGSILQSTPSQSSNFVEQVASVYRDLAERQIRLEAELEALIFDDIDDLYEV